MHKQLKFSSKILVLNIHGNHFTFPIKWAWKVFAKIHAVVLKYRHSPKWNNFKSAIYLIVQEDEYSQQRTRKLQQKHGGDQQAAWYYWSISEQ